jgi:hypothetical protein
MEWRGNARSLKHFGNSIRPSKIELVDDQHNQSQENFDTGNEKFEIVVGQQFALAAFGHAHSLPCLWPTVTNYETRTSHLLHECGSVVG